MYTGDKLCDSCFQNRKNSASSYEHQDLFEKNFGLYFIPFFGLGLWATRFKKTVIDDCGSVYHVYINGRHEIWHENRTGDYDKQKCEKCNDFFTYFYELDSIKN